MAIFRFKGWNMRRLAIIILLLGLLCSLAAQSRPRTQSGKITLPEAVETSTLADSVIVQRESEILEDFGIRDSSRLAEVAKVLKVQDIPRWKTYLKLEAANPKLDEKSLRQLGITPYTAFLASQSALYGYSELSTLQEVAAVLSIPIKKLKAMLGEGLDPNSKAKDNRSLQSLDLSPEMIESKAKEFKDNLLNYGLALTLIGMLVVFSALLITSIVISQLIHMNKAEKKAPAEIRITSSGKLLKVPHDMNLDVIAAAITALHIYETTIKERRRLQLTFNRNSVNTWHNSAALNMPNSEFTRRRR